jgi:NADH-quinone oxidoreductase subunit F
MPALFAAAAPEPEGILGGDLRVLTANCGQGRATTLAEYEAGGGYTALRRALSMGAEAVMAEEEGRAGGAGGAAFPTGVKWEGAHRAAAAKYVVCNADESEPAPS